MRKFLILFIVVQLALFGVELLRPVQDYLVLPWTGFLATLCAKLVTLFDASVISHGKVLQDSVSGFGVSIEPGCNGIEAFIVLFSAIIAFPARWSHKLMGVLGGFVAIQILNVVRVISLFYLGQWDMRVFDFAHEYLWQALIMLDAVVVWLIWVRANPERLVGEGDAVAA